MGRTDWFTKGTDTLNFRNAAKQLTGKATLQRLTELKQTGATLGALSDNERIMLENAALGNLGHLGDGVFESSEGAFIKNLETLKMANMKIFLGSHTGQGLFRQSGLQDIEYNTVVGKRADGSVVTGYDLISDMYQQGKFSVQHQKPVQLYNISGQPVTNQPTKKQVIKPQVISSLTPQQREIATYIVQKFPENPNEMLAIAMGESNLNPNAFGDRNNKYAKEGSHGVFQINTAVHKNRIGNRNVNN